MIAAVVACASNDRTDVAAANIDSAGASAADTTGNPDPLAQADRARILGDSTARTWLIIVSDFECPYCKQWHDSSGEAIRREYVATGKIRLAYINYPLGQHQQAIPTAEAAMCAGVQDKFWPYHDALFATQQRWQGIGDATAVLDSLAQAIGLNVPAHKQCRERHLTMPLIAADRDRANAAGARSTPTLILDGRVVEGVYPMLAMRQMLDAAVARAATR